MADIPADAPRSEDGHYWWDGAQWQLVDQSQDNSQPQNNGQQAAAQQQPLTDDLFANMLQAAETDVVEA